MITKTAHSRSELLAGLNSAASHYFQRKPHHLSGLNVSATVKANGYGGKETTYQGTATYECIEDVTYANPEGA